MFTFFWLFKILLISWVTARILMLTCWFHLFIPLLKSLCFQSLHSAESSWFRSLIHLKEHPILTIPTPSHSFLYLSNTPGSLIPSINSGVPQAYDYYLFAQLSSLECLCFSFPHFFDVFARLSEHSAVPLRAPFMPDSTHSFSSWQCWQMSASAGAGSLTKRTCLVQGSNSHLKALMQWLGNLGI